MFLKKKKKRSEEEERKKHSKALEAAWLAGQGDGPEGACSPGVFNPFTSWAWCAGKEGLPGDQSGSGAPGGTLST